ncbi:hypothetical protein HMPREF9087_0053 [Enterococcus casseliflavus ATCC 12755]|uniref:Uncharacterized protein n=1 Tax=Enterococcus casseliflavus ATCC 12755 TaxID=888066 RepID=F0EF35_ENTCA|nr:hypothetical protein HMPREF9087_0053 [Enterococcus casseliflavus ATCC 12755]
MQIFCYARCELQQEVLLSKESGRISLTNRLAPSKLKAEKQEKKVMAPAYLLLFLR